MQSAKSENAIVRYFRDFSVLKETKREYWGLQIINALDCLSYFAMFNIIVISLSDDFGFSDVHAGYIFTLFTSTTTICLFLSGVFTDSLGIKKALYVAIAGLLITRVSVVFAAHMEAGMTRNVLVVGAIFLMAPFMAMIQTVFQAANKRFTTKRSRGAGFNLWYLFMNIGAAGGGFLVDAMYQGAGLPRFHIFSFGIFTAVLCIICTLIFIKNTDQMVGDEETAEIDIKPKVKQSPWAITKAVATEPVFWRFTALITLLMGVRAVFLYLGLLHPKFWQRVIGPDVEMGTLQAINPILIIIGLILLIPVLERYSVYKMLIVGAFITSLSMFICAIPPMTGVGVAQWTYGTTIVFLVVLTVGELIWSPRLQEYTAAIAPEGQEGTYLGLSMVPYFLAKAFVSFFSGHMLTRWVPAPPADDPLALQRRISSGELNFVDSPYMMWAILAAVALGGTILALIFKDWFTKGVKTVKAVA